MKPGELHLHHLAYDRASTGWRVDLGHAASVRIESGGELSGAVKKAIALRLAVTWNVLEGIPTDALLDGSVRLAFQVARELCDEIEAGKETAWPALRKLATTFRAADKALASVTADVNCDCEERPKLSRPKTAPLKWTITRKGISAVGKGMDGRRVYAVKRHKTSPVWLKKKSDGWGPWSWAWEMTKGMATGSGGVGEMPIQTFDEAMKHCEAEERSRQKYEGRFGRRDGNGKQLREGA